MAGGSKKDRSKGKEKAKDFGSKSRASFKCEIPTKCEVKDSPGKGKGLFALDHIGSGEKIIIERPMMKLKPSHMPDGELGYHPEDIMQQFLALDKKGHAELLQFSGFHDDNDEREWENPNKALPLVTDRPNVMVKFVGNCFQPSLHYVVCRT